MTLLGSVLIFTVAISACCFFGKSILFQLIPSSTAKKNVGVAIPLGMAVMSYSVYVLGSFGIVGRLPLLTIFIVILAASVILKGRRSVTLSSEKAPLTAGDKFLYASILFFAGISLFGALAPPVGTDSLCYHLGIPSKFIMQGSIGFVPYTMNSLYPFFMEMLFTAMEIFSSGVAAKLFHWICGPLTVLIILFFAREVSSRKTGLIAAVLFISSPGIFNGMTYAYVDVGLTMYITLSVFFFVLWDKGKQEKKRDTDLFLSGVFMGIALSIKYSALYMFIPLFLLLIWRIIKGKGGKTRMLFLFMIPCFFLSFFWYLKSFIVLGNPVFPVFSDFFPGVVTFDVSHHMGMGTGKGLMSLLSLPWNMSVHPQIFGGRGSQIGVQFFLFLPFVIYSMFNPKKWIRDISFLSASYVLIWFFLVQRDRFLYPVLPLLGLLASVSIAGLLSKYKERNIELRSRVLLFVTGSIFLVVLLFNGAIGLYHNRHHYPVVFNMETEEEYLSRWVTNYQMAQYVNQNLPEDARILGIGIYKPYYFKRWVVREKIFDLWEQYREKFEDGTSLKAFLKEKGFTYIIYDEKVGQICPPYLQKIINNSILVYSYGPVKNIETGWIETFYLYKL